mmetsp:Transcript_48715/g.54497  ORF Transcript_48715/g.54497 Transcript_48715/m.54497 type:complete len:661 (-) Transcript_48715:333-2315(-)|eukprot:CAMPEP_0170781402 /NCGR_PEP_ID=MMETSP0733-20121128/14178_1 /TAXON_ID=186038 /ORGANISM="Fragilariopsis kerguelensis, Strain L26-C5" /LENGTH=660 /DNA_ID=CAMNT_0011125435 /DNA_START=68 /DNA_END=2050 /DNA_ORIENTATION=-
MTSYQSNVHDSNTNEEVDRLINNLTPIPNQSPSSYKRYLKGGIAALCFLGVGFHHRPFRATASEDAESSLSGTDEQWPQLIGECRISDENSCDGDKICCPMLKGFFGGSPLGLTGTCVVCCTDADCIRKIEQPPAGEFGKMYCNDDTHDHTCEGKKGLIGKDGYIVWSPSETIDNSKSFRKYMMKREVISDDPEDPAYESAWYFDFNEQDNNEFDINKIDCNGTHITLPSYGRMHAGYSKKYKHYKEEETGIVTLFMSENKYSLIADFPKVSFVEKYHTLTFDGEKDIERGEYLKELSAKQVEEEPVFNLQKWLVQAYKRAIRNIHEQVVMRQVQAGIDTALTWQIRRFVNAYDNDGSVTPSTSKRWASHSAKAQEAIKLAKDPDFEREYLKSELHCKHLEEAKGGGFTVDHTKDTVTIPLGRPITTFSGEMVNAPTHYLGLGQGTMTAHYDEDQGILQLFLEGFGNARQYSDVKFVGTHGHGMFVGPVSKGDDYIVDPDVDGRLESLYTDDQPKDLDSGRGKILTPLLWFLTSVNILNSDPPDLTMWRQPVSDRCSDKTRDASFWEAIDPEKGENNVFEHLVQKKRILMGTVRGMACSTSYMKPDYGWGTSNFDANEIGVWVHTLGEVRDNWTKKMTLATWWDEWECFYQGKELSDCHY